MSEQELGGVVYVDRSQPVVDQHGTGFMSGVLLRQMQKANEAITRAVFARVQAPVDPNPQPGEPSHPQYVVDAAKTVRRIDAQIPSMPSALRIAVDYLDPTPQSRRWVADVLARGGVPYCIQANRAHRAAKAVRLMWPDPPPPVLAILDYLDPVAKQVTPPPVLAILDYLDPVAKQVTPEVYNQRVETCRTSCQQPNVSNDQRPKPDLRTMADAPKQNRPQVEDLVCEDIQKRAGMGRKKYGQSVRDNPLTREQWMQHAYEEALDFAVYLRRAKQDEVRVGDAVSAVQQVLQKVRMHGIGSPDPDVVANALDVLTTQTEALIAALRPKV